MGLGRRRPYGGTERGTGVTGRSGRRTKGSNRSTYLTRREEGTLLHTGPSWDLMGVETGTPYFGLTLGRGLRWVIPRP